MAQGQYGLGLQGATAQAELTQRAAELSAQLGVDEAQGMRMAALEAASRAGQQAQGLYGMQLAGATSEAQISARAAELTAQLGVDQAQAVTMARLEAASRAGQLAQGLLGTRVGLATSEAELTQRAREISAQLGVDQAQAETLARLEAQSRGGQLALGEQGLGLQGATAQAELTQRAAELSAQLGVTREQAQQLAQLEAMGQAGQLATSTADRVQGANNLAAQLDLQGQTVTAELEMQRKLADASNNVAMQQLLTQASLEADQLRVQAANMLQQNRLADAQLLANRANDVEQNALRKAEIEQQGQQIGYQREAQTTEQMLTLLNQMVSGGLSAAELAQRGELAGRETAADLMKTGMTTAAGLLPETERNELVRAQVTDAIKQQGFDNVMNLTQFLAGDAINRESLAQAAQGNTLQAYAIQKNAEAAINEHMTRQAQLSYQRDQLREQMRVAKTAEERTSWQDKIDLLTDLLNVGDTTAKGIWGDDYLKRFGQRAGITENPNVYRG